MHTNNNEKLKKEIEKLKKALEESNSAKIEMQKKIDKLETEKANFNKNLKKAC